MIPKSGPEIRNHRSAEVVLEGFLASILKFGHEITNQCSRGIAAVCKRAILLCGDENAENRCLNGRAYGSNFIRHSELCKGARLEFTMSDQAIY